MLERVKVRRPAQVGVTVALALVLSVGCGTTTDRIGESGPPIDVPIGRLDRLLFHADSIRPALLRAYAQYGTFYRTYVEDILHMAPVGDPRLPELMVGFTRDADWRAAQMAVDSVLGDMASQQEQFGRAFARLHAAFPDSLVPRVVAFNSGFNYGIYPTDSVLGVGVEWFIGPQQKVITYLAPDIFPQYIKDRMVPVMLVPSAVKGWLMVHYIPDIRGKDLLTHLVGTGKVLALLDALLPDVDPTRKFAFTADQLRWCMDNEYMIWKELVAKEMLFNTSSEVIDRIMNDAPFTNGFPRESPGHIGEWIGYRMVMSYLEEHPDMTFAELFRMHDPRAVLQRYKPR
ncbi:MAG: hypothetical protein H6597_00700 [Flavobacteriales bacterium]|nr:hypothetical protein [Flavobacteriales bacterium]MCB9193023.1 hypothetical protein [Flavobacteriales bacterium]